MLHPTRHADQNKISAKASLIQPHPNKASQSMKTSKGEHNENIVITSVF